MMMMPRYSTCNHCGEMIMETHLWTIKDGSIYHWGCVIEMRNQAKKLHEEPRRPIVVEPIDGEPRPSVREYNYSFWDWLFRRKT